MKLLQGNHPPARFNQPISSSFSLNSLYVGMSNATKEDDQDRLNQLETSIIADGPIETAFQGDLFSEIHGGEVARLKGENDLLSTRLDDLKSGIDRALGPLLQKLQVTGLSGWSRYMPNSTPVV